MKKYVPAVLQLVVALVTVAVPMFAGNVSPVPEPASVLMIGGGLGALILLARRKRSQK